MRINNTVIYMYQEYFANTDRPGNFWVIITKNSNVKKIRSDPIYGNKGHVIDGTERVLDCRSINPILVAAEYVKRIPVTELNPIDKPEHGYKPVFWRTIVYPLELKETIEEKVNNLFRSLKEAQ